MTLRALYSGVSGLRGLQTAIDVIGNNIANVNTVGFKAGRVTFADLFSQTLSSAQGADNGRGGINPKQVGLGVTVGSIDNIFTQGSIQTTNRLLDLAIEGSGFFVVTNGAGNYYTRAGNFTLDENGYIASANTGMRMIGLMADESGEVPSTATPQAVRIILGASAAAETTENVNFGGNLNSSTQTDMARALSTLVSLFDAEGRSLQLRNGDVIRITAGEYDADPAAAGGEVSLAGMNILTITQETTLADLVQALTEELQRVTGSSTLDVDFNIDGTLSFSTGAGETISGLRISVGDTLGRDMSALENVFTGLGQYTRDVTVGEAQSVKTQFFRQPDATTSIDVFDSQGNARTVTVAYVRNFGRLAAAEATALADLRDREGTQIFSPTLPPTAVVRINGTGFAAPRDILLSGLADQTLQGLLDAVATELSAEAGGAVTYVVNEDGSVTFNNGGAALAGVNFSVVDDPSATQPVESRALGEILAGTGLGADDGIDLPAGVDAVTNLFFRNEQIRNEWNYHAIAPFQPQATVDNNEIGTIVFRSNGQFQGYLVRDPQGNYVVETTPPVLTFDPDGTGPQNDGVDALSINLNMNALTQYAAPTTAAIESQDGSPVGELDSITINQAGMITGIFTNGTSRTLAQVLLASFANQQGLEKQGDSLFRESANSGEATIGSAGTRGRGIIRSTTLELSNVDLATEFTNLIVSQRAFQANSRIITTGDNILNEVVNLVR